MARRVTARRTSVDADVPLEVADPHGVLSYLIRRLEQLQGNDPIGRDSLQVSRKARDAILEYYHAQKNVVGLLRLRTLLAWLPKVAGELGGEFLNPTKDASIAFAKAFPPSKYSPTSIMTAIQCVRPFWAWRAAREGHELPPYLRLKAPRWKSSFTAKDMLTREEVAQVADACQNFRDRAWVWTVYSSACRPGEIFRLTVGDVVPKDQYVELQVRREKESEHSPSFIYEDAVPALLAWIRVHPRRDDPSAQLWCDAASGEPVTYRGMYKVVDVAARRAKMGKPVTLYNLRRSKLTSLAADPAISQEVLGRIAGWAPGSKVAAHYVHLSSSDVERTLNSRYGIAKEPSKPVPRTPVKCGRCAYVNPAETSFCGQCGGPLNYGAVVRVRHEDQLAQVLEDPEVKRFLAEKLASLLK